MKQIMLLLPAQCFKNTSVDVDVHSSLATLLEERWDISPIGLIANEYPRKGYTGFDQ
jgi:hypothetical protein